MTVTPDETPARCACTATTYTPEQDRWHMAPDGWECWDCIKEGTW